MGCPKEQVDATAGPGAEREVALRSKTKSWGELGAGDCTQKNGTIELHSSGVWIFDADFHSTDTGDE